MRVNSFYIAAALSLVGVTPAAAVDWGKVPGQDIVMLYPGQTSWEWNLTMADHSAADKFKAGKNCIACHKGEEKTQGDLMVSGKKAEPNPIKGFPGHAIVNVRMAYDDTHFYTRLEMKAPKAPDTKMDAKTESSLALIFNDAAVNEGVRAGCWASCHEDNASMPTANGSDRTKYLMKTRAKLSRSGGGDTLRDADALAKLTASGYVQEWWQAKLNPGAKAEAEGGIIFDKRESLKGVLEAEASQSGDTWVVVFKRPLNAPAPWRPLEAGKVYTIGFSSHLGHSAKRFHHTSYEYTFALGQTQADIVAVKQ